jgi:hypothetical protein
MGDAPTVAMERGPGSVRTEGACPRRSPSWRSQPDAEATAFNDSRETHYGADLVVTESGKLAGNATRRALQTLKRLSPRSERASLGDASYASGPSHGQPLGRSLEREMMTRAIDGKGSW